MKTVTVTCDGCGNDRTKTNNSVDYRLALLVERLPIDTGPQGNWPVTDMMFYPPIKQDAYFCSIRCLKKWLIAEHS